MKKLILSATAVMFMIGLGWALGNAWGQNGKAAAVDNSPHKVGLIDMALLFSKYKKFANLREDLKVEIESADASLKAQLEKIKKLQLEMKDLAPSSAQYVAAEKKITELAAGAEAERRTCNADLCEKKRRSTRPSIVKFWMPSTSMPESITTR